MKVLKVRRMMFSPCLAASISLNLCAMKQSTLEEWSVISFFFETKRILKIVPAVLLLDLIPKAVPIMTPTMSRILSKQMGMANLFFRYH